MKAKTTSSAINYIFMYSFIFEWKKTVSDKKVELRVTVKRHSSMTNLPISQSTKKCMLKFAIFVRRLSFHCQNKIRNFELTAVDLTLVTLLQIHKYNKCVLITNILWIYTSTSSKVFFCFKRNLLLNFSCVAILMIDSLSI